MSPTFTIKIVNERGDDDQLSALLKADAAHGVDGIALNTSVKLNTVESRTITVGTIQSGRLYIGYGDLTTAPLPNGGQYFGWVEFNRLDDGQVWINLSNVDVVGLPLTLRGQADGKPFTLGYKVSKNQIVSRLTAGIVQPDAVIQSQTNGATFTKVVGPTIMPDAYRSFRAYREGLASAGAKLTVTSDSSPDRPNQPGIRKTFRGSMSPADPIVNLVSDDGTTFQVNRDQFLTPFIYRCDGGTLIYGNKTVPQNQLPLKSDTPQQSDDKMFANSVYRNLLIGINEGYLTNTGRNTSADFGGMTPFQSGEGNEYARVLHESSNSYGYPYADSNLKVLIKADPEVTITIAIIGDDDAKDYSEVSGPNQPQFGDYQFAIGAGSSALGVISIAGWRYFPTDHGAYGGFLPAVDDWTQMNFSRPGRTQRHIWFRTTGPGEVVSEDCFTPAAPFFDDRILKWPAGAAWIPGHPSPDKPQSR